MSKRFLGIICLLYSGLITYMIITDNLKNYLAPNMQVYIKISIIPLVLMGLVLCLNNRVHYHFKVKDILLLLPIIMLIFAGDGRLTTIMASNRMGNYKNKTKEVKPIEPIEENEPIEEEIKTDEPIVEEFIPDFDVVDETYNELANYITYPPRTDKLANKKIRVRGLSLKSASYLPSKYVMIGKYSITCCAADSEFIGFILDYNKDLVKNNTWYEVEGTLKEDKDASGYTIMVVKVTNIKEIDESKEEQYIYPCNNYGDGTCSEVLKYDLEY